MNFIKLTCDIDDKAAWIKDHLQPKTPKTFGLQIVRTQRVRLKLNGLYGAPLFKTIKHAAG